MQEVDHRYLNVLALVVLCRLAAVGVAPAGQGENNDVLWRPSNKDSTYLRICDALLEVILSPIHVPEH
jgi:hypothetical protein